MFKDLFLVIIGLLIFCCFICGFVDVFGVVEVVLFSLVVLMI